MTACGGVGGACVNGACVKLGKYKLATGLGAPDKLAADDAYVYYVDSTNGVVGRIPNTGGAPTILASGQSGPADIALDSQYVYWTNTGGAVMRTPVGGGGPAEVITVQALPTAIAVDATHVYWENTAPGDRMLKRWNKATGVIESLAQADGSQALSLSAKYVYFFHPGGSIVYRLPKGGGTEQLADSLHGLLLDGGIACNGPTYPSPPPPSECVWEDDGSSRQWATIGRYNYNSHPVGFTSSYVVFAGTYYELVGNAEYPHTAIGKAPLCGGAATWLVVSSAAAVRDIIVHGNSVYFSEGTFIVRYDL